MSYIRQRFSLLESVRIELQAAMNARARILVVVLAGTVLRLPAVLGTAEVMKDITLGFGEALKHCREEVIIIHCVIT